MSDTRRSAWRESLTQNRSVPAFERLNERMQRLTKGDRTLLYGLVLLVGIASICNVYALERALLVEVPAYGGTLSEGVLGNPQFINPLLAISDADRDLSALTYSGLMGLSESGALVPVLAESYTISEDGKTYTFLLRPNAKFTDGSPVSADDVVFTVKKAQDPAIKSPEYANWSGVNITAVDKRTVRFTIAKPYVPFLGLTTLGILPARLWKNVSNTEFPFSALQTSPVGTGPFKVTDISRNASGLIERALLEANPYYVLGRPYLNSIRFNFYANTEDLKAALQSGAIESSYGVNDSDAITAPYARVFGIFFNPNENQAYVHIEVRKALSLAIDRQNIVTKALGGYATPILGPIPPGDATIKQIPVPTLANPTIEAARILEAGGWVYDGGARMWKNSRAKQTLRAITLRAPNVPELKNVASAVKDDWEKLGVAVTIELYEPGDLSQNVIRPRKYEALLYGMVIGRDQDLYAFWDSQERNDPGLNIALYANKNVDALIEDVRSATNADRRQKDLQKIEDIISADYPAAFLYAPNFIYSMPTDLRGVALPQIITPSDRFAAVVSWYRDTDAVWPFFVRR